MLKHVNLEQESFEDTVSDQCDHSAEAQFDLLLSYQNTQTYHHAADGRVITWEEELASSENRSFDQPFPTNIEYFPTPSWSKTGRSNAGFNTPLSFNDTIDPQDTWTTGRVDVLNRSDDVDANGCPSFSANEPASLSDNNFDDTSFYPLARPSTFLPEDCSHASLNRNDTLDGDDGDLFRSSQRLNCLPDLLDTNILVPPSVRATPHPLFLPPRSINIENRGLPVQQSSLDVPMKFDALRTDNPTASSQQQVQSGLSINGTTTATSYSQLASILEDIPLEGSFKDGLARTRATVRYEDGSLMIQIQMPINYSRVGTNEATILSQAEICHEKPLTFPSQESKQKTPPPLDIDSLEALTTSCLPQDIAGQFDFPFPPQWNSIEDWKVEEFADLRTMLFPVTSTGPLNGIDETLQLEGSLTHTGASLSSVTIQEKACHPHPEDPPPSQFRESQDQVAKVRRRRPMLTPMEKPNNQFGRSGTFKCWPCRKLRRKCNFTGEWRVCDRCRTHPTNEPCLKLLPARNRSQLYPSDPPPIPSDPAIPQEEVLLLQYIYTGAIKTEAGTILTRLLTKLGSAFGFSIPHISLHNAMLAFAEASLPAGRNPERQELYLTTARETLKTQDSELPQEEDVFAAFLIALVHISNLSGENRAQDVITYLDHYLSIIRQVSSHGSVRTSKFWAVTFSLIYDSLRALPLSVDSYQSILRLYEISRDLLGDTSLPNVLGSFAELFNNQPEAPYFDFVVNCSFLLRLYFLSAAESQREGFLARDPRIEQVLSDLLPSNFNPHGFQFFCKRAMRESHTHWFIVLLSKYCYMILILLRAQTIITGLGSHEGIHAACSLLKLMLYERPLVRKLQHFELRAIPEVSRAFARMLWMGGLTLAFPVSVATENIGVVQVLEDRRSITRAWVITEIEECGEPQMARCLERFWLKPHIKHIIALLTISSFTEQRNLHVYISSLIE